MSNGSNFDIAAEIVKCLGKDFARTEDFVEHMRDNYGYVCNRRPNLCAVILSEIETGCVETMSFPAPSVVRRNWVMDEAGIREEKAPQMIFEEEADFYKTPRISFYVEREWVLVEEMLGRRFMYRRLHRIAFTGNTISLGEPLKRRVYSPPGGSR